VHPARGGHPWPVVAEGGDAVISTLCTSCGSPEVRPDGRCARCGAPLLETPKAGPRVTPAPSRTRIALPVAAPATPQVEAVAAAPWWLKHGERWQLIIGAVVVILCMVVLGGYLVVVKINNARYPPDKPVLELFAALQARDGAAAARLAGCASPSCPAAVSAGYQPPTDVRVTKVQYLNAEDGRTDTSHAAVKVTYQLAGTGEQQTTIQVQRSGTLLKRPFKIVSGASGHVTLTAAAQVDRVHLGSLDVAVADEQRSAQQSGEPVRLLPGTYTARLPDDDPLFAAAGGDVRVDVAAHPDDLAQPLPITMDVQIRPEITAAVDAQVEQLLTSCTRQRVLEPRGCSFRVPGIVIGAQQVRWTVLQLPVVRVDADDDPVPGTKRAVVRTVTPGQVSVTYSAFTSAGGDRRQFTTQLPTTVRGDITVPQPGATPVISLS
jgi:hypothetical protein